MDKTRESQYMRSLFVIKAEITWIDENLKAPKLPPQIKAYFEDSKSSTSKQRITLVNFIREGKIDEQKYVGFVKETFASNQELFSSFRSSGQPKNILEK